MDFLASGDDDQSTAGMRYSMTGVQLDFEPDAAGQDSTSVGLSPEVTALPSDLPDVVRSLARQVTAGASTSFDKATVLQKWFREDGGFEYTLVPEEVEESEVGNDELVAFLRDDETGRRGYCEQFAAAMAVMARSLSIPARVAVGFLEPEPIGATTWEYSAHDLHAWVELYFPGVGWVLFDPTPGGRDGRVPNDLVPAYTEARAPVVLPTVDPSDETRDPRSDRPSPAASERPVNQSSPTAPMAAPRRGSATSPSSCSSCCWCWRWWPRSRCCPASGAGSCDSSAPPGGPSWSGRSCAPPASTSA